VKEKEQEQEDQQNCAFIKRNVIHHLSYCWMTVVICFS